MLEDGILTVSGTAAVGLDDDADEDDEGEENDVDDDGFCLVTNAGSVVTCQ